MVTRSAGFSTLCLEMKKRNGNDRNQEYVVKLFDMVEKFADRLIKNVRWMNDKWSEKKEDIKIRNMKIVLNKLG